MVHRILRVDVLVPDYAGDSVPVVQILQHHLMDLEQKGFLLTQLGLSLHIEFGQLNHSFPPGLVKAGYLSLCVGHLAAGLSPGIPS